MQQPFQQQLIAGDTWQWFITIPDNLTPDGFSVDAFALKYFFRGPGKLDLVAAVDNSGIGQYVINADATQSNLQAGVYAWQMCLFDADNNRTELDRGTVEVVGDIFSQDAGYDARSFVKKMLDLLEANLLGTASRIEQEYQINGRMLKLWDRATLQKERDTYAWRYRNELIASGQLPANANTIQPVFTSDQNSYGVWK